MASSVPSAVSALISMAQAALPISATVWFGKPLARFTAPITLQIFGITGEQEIIVMGPDYKREETFEIDCLLSSFAGSPDFQGRMNEVYAAFDLLTVAIGNNPTLNETVRFAEIKQFDYIPDASASGQTLGSLSFKIACQARISSLT